MAGSSRYDALARIMIFLPASMKAVSCGIIASGWRQLARECITSPWASLGR